MNPMSQDRKNRVAQWAFDTKAILGRFHIWLDDVEVAFVRGQSQREFTSHLSFLSGAIERQFAMTGALTALGTRLFGRFGGNEGFDQSDGEETDGPVDEKVLVPGEIVGEPAATRRADDGRDHDGDAEQGEALPALLGRKGVGEN